MFSKKKKKLSRIGVIDRVNSFFLSKLAYRNKFIIVRPSNEKCWEDIFNEINESIEHLFHMLMLHVKVVVRCCVIKAFVIAF